MGGPRPYRYGSRSALKVKAGDRVMMTMMAMIHLMVKNGGVFRGWIVLFN
jgi:hypothetical protein